MKHILCLFCCLLCAVSLTLPASAQAPDGAEIFCFNDESLSGICITGLPEANLGAVMLGNRAIQVGDVLTAQQAAEMTFLPCNSEEDSSAEISYLPVFSDGLEQETIMSFSIRGRENKPPVAEDAAFETYKNLEVTGQLKVHDPEGDQMQFTVTREPRRGTLNIREDGSFTYTPKKNKVGIDSFSFTATDAAGKVSRDTTVTISILKPTDACQYSDTAGKSCRFAAEWMKNTGIFIGESIGGSPCFSPDRAVTRGEFLTMLVNTLKLPVEPEISQTGYRDTPDWLAPYLAAAIRSGLISAVPAQDSFGSDEWMTTADAAAMLCMALKLQPEQDSDAADAMTVAAENGFCFPSEMNLTRGDTAELLYLVSQYRDHTSEMMT